MLRILKKNVLGSRDWLCVQFRNTFSRMRSSWRHSSAYCSSESAGSRLPEGVAKVLTRGLEQGDVEAGGEIPAGVCGEGTDGTGDERAEIGVGARVAKAGLTGLTGFIELV